MGKILNIANFKRGLRKVTSGALSLALLTALSLPSVYSANDNTMLVPMGNVVGISIRTKGVIVIQVAQYRTEDGTSCPSGDAGVLPGDIITSIDGKETLSAEELREVMSAHQGGNIKLHIVRGDGELTLTVNPHYNEGEKRYELGLWLRDGMTGLGTLTFYDPDNGAFGALGHAINEIDTGIFVPIRTGNIMSATVTEVVIGMPGAPGQLHGVFEKDKVLGSVANNSCSGLFGTISDKSFIADRKAIPVARESEIVTGKAVILSDIEGGEVKEYSIEISRIYTGTGTEGRNMMIKVTDEHLLEVSGGIVQGMSGSPIIQNGKLIGAVTHVLINDPAKGYGISIENMLGEAETLRNAAA